MTLYIQTQNPASQNSQTFGRPNLINRPRRSATRPTPKHLPCIYHVIPPGQATYPPTIHRLLASLDLPGGDQDVSHHSLWGSRLIFHQVRKKSADPDHFCVAVSRFFENPIQNNFSEIKRLHQNPLRRVSDPNEVVGYMRKQQFERVTAASPLISSEVQPLVGVTERRLVG